ncbi:MAG: hypothetical protein KQH63_10840 [Desulfobulbaceae bacterium]|nr:hypothetical protein [Desulfobulbaceae bacterium]
MKTLHALARTKGLLVVAHRGASGTAPENTISAMKKALACGVAMIEIDVRLTKDATIIVFHDSTLDRTTNGTGKVRDFSFQELSRLDAGSWFSEKFAGEKIPLLSDILSLLRGKACVNIEIKPPAKDEDFQKRIDHIAKATLEAEFVDFTLFSSFHHESLKYLNSRHTGFHTAALLPPDDTRLPSQILQETGCGAFVCALDQLSERVSADISRHNIITGVYTVNTEEELRQAEAGKATAIVTNYPERMVQYLRERAT